MSKDNSIKLTIEIGQTYISRSNYTMYAKITNIYKPTDFNYKEVKKEKGWKGNPIVIRFESTNDKNGCVGIINHFRKSDFIRKYKRAGEDLK